MRLPSILPFSFSLTLFLTLTLASANTLNITVINTHNNHSTLECWALECWALEPGFQSSTQAGTSGTQALNLGPIGSNASYTVLPAGFDGGRHNAPAKQWVIFLTGLAHITLPNTTTTSSSSSSKTEAWITGGKHGAILTLDTPDVSTWGHITKYPSDQETVALQIPLKEGEVPGHVVLYEGGCVGEEVDG
ncbi:hypothetical protein PENSUB_246 [Penicillium subrubescens]|uniref:Small secreted protein n=1 Tax=Penicillium subrubescens TaxID=1316194 RepID=A0A1Q5UNC4_9EURO|nr:hypothetical protein PENSUB_246 [Penicillium subrubescens]